MPNFRVPLLNLLKSGEQAELIAARQAAETAEQKAARVALEATQAGKQADFDQAFGPGTKGYAEDVLSPQLKTGNTAEESAKILENAPSTDFQLMGEPQSRDFSLVGKPYGGQPARIPEVLPPEMNLPVHVPENTGLPMVKGPQSLSTIDVPNATPVAGGSKFPTKSAVALGGLTGAALLSQLVSGNKPPVSEPVRQMAAVKPETAPPLPVKPDNKKAAVSDKKETKKTEPVKKEEKIEEKQVDPFLDFSGTTVGTKEELADAQDRARKNALVAEMGRAGELVGSSIARAKPIAQDVFAEHIKSADQPVKDYNAQVENQKNDPNSKISVSHRAMFEKLGFNFKGNPSAADLEKVLPIGLKIKEGEENRAARKDIAESQSKDRALTRAMLAQRQKETLDDKSIRQARQQLEIVKRNAIAGGGTAGNQIRNKIQFADNLFGTVGADANMSEKDIEAMPSKTWNSVNRVMVAETALELNRLLTSTGVSAQGTLEKLIPHNIMMDRTKLQDYVTNRLNPAEQGEFVKQALKTASRIKKIGKDQNKQLMSKYVGGTSRLRDMVPEDYDAAMTALGLDPNEIDSFNPDAPVTRETSSVSFSSDVVNYAKKHGITPEQAQQIKDQRTGAK